MRWWPRPTRGSTAERKHLYRAYDECLAARAIDRERGERSEATRDALSTYTRAHAALAEVIGQRLANILDAWHVATMAEVFADESGLHADLDDDIRDAWEMVRRERLREEGRQEVLEAVGPALETGQKIRDALENQRQQKSRLFVAARKELFALWRTSGQGHNEFCRQLDGKEPDGVSPRIVGFENLRHHLGIAKREAAGES